MANATQTNPPTRPPSAAIAATAVDDVRDVIVRISHDVWENAERSLAEEKSAAIHIRELQAAGFHVCAFELPAIVCKLSERYCSSPHRRRRFDESVARAC